MNKWRRVVAALMLFFAGLSLASAQGKDGAHKQDFKSYRGQRKPVESGDLYMESFVSEYDGSTLTIDMGFNQGIDPRSIKGENIQINGKPVSGPLKLSFNKEGTVVRLVIGDYVSIPYSFFIWGIRSYSGREMDKDGLENVGRRDSFSYQDDGWKRR